MTFKDLYSILEKNNFYLFTYEDILSFCPKEKRYTLKKAFYRWTKKGWIYPLKKGLYELTYPKELIIPDMYIANKLYRPSYVSLETALSNYSIIPEVSMAVTSVTTKPTRKFKNKHGLFVYRTVKPIAFTGYYVEKQGSFNILVAEPEKALLDYLHFRTYQNKVINFDDERFDKNIISQLKRKRLNAYAKLYNLNLKEFYAYF